MSATVTNLLDYKRRRASADALEHACLKAEPPVLPSVMARIGSRDQFLSVEVDISAFLVTADNVAICALLSGLDSWASAELIEWASQRHPGVRQVLDYIDVTRDTEYETDYEIRLDEIQFRHWVQVHRPVLAAELTGSI